MEEHTSNVHANAPPKERPPSDQRTLFGKRSLDESGEGSKRVRVEPTVEADTEGLLAESEDEIP